MRLMAATLSSINSSADMGFVEDQTGLPPFQSASGGAGRVEGVCVFGQSGTQHETAKKPTPCHPCLHPHLNQPCPTLRQTRRRPAQRNCTSSSLSTLPCPTFEDSEEAPEMAWLGSGVGARSDKSEERSDQGSMQQSE